MKKEETKKFRARIIGAIEGTPGITAKELAVQLDVRQSNLYYHLKYLMNAKEVSVSIHQTQNGINEKYYYPSSSTDLDANDAVIISENDIPTVENIPEDKVKPKSSEIREDTVEIENSDINTDEQLTESTIEMDDDIVGEDNPDNQQSTVQNIDTNEGVVENDISSLRDILMGKSAQSTTDDEIGDNSVTVEPEFIDLDKGKVKDTSVGGNVGNDNEEFDEVLINDILFLIPKDCETLDEMVNNTRTKGNKIIDLQTQTKVFEYLKSNYSFGQQQKLDDEEFNDIKQVEDDIVEDTEKTYESNVKVLEESDRSDVKLSTNPLRSFTKKLSFKSYELAVQQSGKSFNVLLTQNLGDKLKLIFNEKLNAPLHEQMQILDTKIDYIIDNFNIKESRIKASIESDQIFTQKLEFETPDVNKKEIEELIKVKIQRELQLDPNKSYFNFNIKKSGDVTNVNAQIADANSIDQYIQFFDSKGINISYISSLATICNQLLQKTYGTSSEPKLILYLGYSRSNLMVIQNGTIIMSTRIGASISDLIKKMKGSMYGGDSNIIMNEQDIIALIESDDLMNENNSIIRRLNLPFSTVKQLIDDFIKTIRNDMILSIRQFQKIQSTNINEGFVVSYIDKNDAIISLLAEDLNFELREIEIEKFFHQNDHSHIRDYFAMLVGLSVADRKDQNLLPKNIREKAIYYGRTKVLAVSGAICASILSGLLIFNLVTLSNSNADLNSTSNNFDTNKRLYTNSVNVQKTAIMLEFIENDIKNKRLASENLNRFLSYLGNELPSGVKLNTFKSSPIGENKDSRQSVYPYRYEIKGFVTSDLSNALIILEGMKTKLEESEDINLVSFENNDFYKDESLNLPKQYFTMICELQ